MAKKSNSGRVFSKVRQRAATAKPPVAKTPKSIGVSVRATKNPQGMLDGHGNVKDAPPGSYFVPDLYIEGNT